MNLFPKVLTIYAFPDNEVKYFYNRYNISVAISRIIDSRWQPNPGLSEIGKISEELFLKLKPLINSETYCLQ